jgi:hypothetical protein
MTPIIGLLIAVLAGFLAPSRRGVLAGVIPPMLAVTAAQSWYLMFATDRGSGADLVIGPRFVAACGSGG